VIESGESSVIVTKQPGLFGGDWSVSCDDPGHFQAVDLVVAGKPAGRGDMAAGFQVGTIRAQFLPTGVTGGEIETGLVHATMCASAREPVPASPKRRTGRAPMIVGAGAPPS